MQPATVGTTYIQPSTVQGGNVTVDGRSGVMVDSASVQKADIETSNGVIHVIDKVLIPSG